jgi:Flp pilus assembly protein TadD
VSQRFDLGVHFTLTGEYERAVRSFQAVLVDEPLNGRCWGYLGMALAHLGRSAEAEAALARSLSLSPGNGVAWFHLGISRGLRGEWHDAATALRRAVAYLPEDMVAWHRLGVALSESQEPDAAAAAFERALVLSRETGAGPLELPVKERADPHAAEVLEPEGPRQAKSWLDLALSLLSLGEEEEAIAAYERALALDPSRAQNSLFRPMLQLLTLAAGSPVEDEPPSPRPEIPRPIRPFRFEPGDGLRPPLPPLDPPDLG